MPLELDRSYLPLDTEVLARHYVPGILAPIDLTELARLRETRDWIYSFGSLFKLRAADKVPREARPGGLKTRFKALMGNARAKQHARDGHPGFDDNIYLYGRPFFITEEDPAAIADILNRLMARPSDDAIVELFAAQAEHFDVDLAHEIAEFVKRRPPTARPLQKAKDVFHKILHDRQVALRDALISLGREDEIPEGIASEALEEEPDMDQSTRLDPVARFAHLAANGIGLTLAEIHPFWCHRTSFDLKRIAELVGGAELAGAHDHLLEPLWDKVPEAREHVTPFIETHFTAGAVVPAASVRPLLELLTPARARLIEKAEADELDPRPENLWRKLVEALTYAASVDRGLIEVDQVRVEDEGGMP